MPLADLQRAGSNAYVARLLALGKTSDQIYYDLQRRFPGEAQNSYSAALDRGREALDAGALMDNSPLGYRLPAGLPPSSGGPRVGFRYYTAVTFADITTGKESARPFEVYSSTSLTVEQVIEQASALAQPLTEGAARRGRYKEVKVGEVITNVAVTAVERGHE